MEHICELSFESAATCGVRTQKTMPRMRAKKRLSDLDDGLGMAVKSSLRQMWYKTRKTDDLKMRD